MILIKTGGLPVFLFVALPGFRHNGAFEGAAELVDNGVELIATGFHMSEENVAFLQRHLRDKVQESEHTGHRSAQLMVIDECVVREALVLDGELVGTFGDAAFEGLIQLLELVIELDQRGLAENLQQGRIVRLGIVACHPGLSSDGVRQ